MKFASERVSGSRFPLQQAQRILDRVDQWPVEFEQLSSSAAGEDESRQQSACGHSTLSQLAAKLREGDRFVALDLGETSLQGGEGVGVGKNLGGLL